MTIGANNRNDALGNDLVAAFEYEFKIFAATDLEVKVKNLADGSITLLTYPTQYAVSGVEDADGGEVTLTAVGGDWQVSGAAELATGYSISIRRVVALVQATDIRNQGDFFAEIHEDAFDYLTMIDQQQSDDLARAVKLDSAFATDDYDMTLPAPVANGAIGFDATGTGLAIISSLSGAATTAFTLSLLDDADGEAFMDTLTASMATETAPAVGDKLILEDVSAGTWDKITLANMMKVLGGLTLETAPATGDMIGLYDLSATDSRSMTLANLWTIINAFTEDLTPDKTADFVNSYDVSASSVKKIKLQNMPLGRGHIGGLRLSNNVSDATNDIDIAAGEARSYDDTANLRLSSALTKQLDAAWAVGTNQGMRDTGSIANGTWHLHEIMRSDTNVVDILASLSGEHQDTFTVTIASPGVVTMTDHGMVNGASFTPSTTGALPTGMTAGTQYFVVNRTKDTFQFAATQGGAAINTTGSQSGTHTCTVGPVMPANYDKRRCIGSVLREGAVIVPFTQDGDYFTRTVAVLDVNTTNPGTSAVTSTLSVPTGRKVEAEFNVFIASGAVAAPILISDLAVTDAAPSSSAAPLLTAGSTNTNTGIADRVRIRTNRDAQIRYRALGSDGSTAVRFATTGWYDTRGRSS